MRRQFGNVERRTKNSGLNLAPKKSLGQHFLRDEHVLMRIVQETESLLTDKSCKICDEIGPGEGVLSKQFLTSGWRVHAIEKDSRSVELLQGTLQKEFADRFACIQSDILKWEPPFRPNALPFCVGNLPYYITSDILLWFSAYRKNYAAGIFMIQKEVAERIQARSGTKAYGRLSVRLQLCFDCAMLFTVPASAFFPPPKVDSAIIRLVPNGFEFNGADDERAFEGLTATLFSARRKMLRRALAGILGSHFEKNSEREMSFWKALEKHNIFPETRPDAIPPQAILALHRLLCQMRD